MFNVAFYRKFYFVAGILHVFRCVYKDKFVNVCRSFSPNKYRVSVFLTLEYYGCQKCTLKTHLFMIRLQLNSHVLNCTRLCGSNARVVNTRQIIFKREIDVGLWLTVVVLSQKRIYVILRIIILGSLG